MSPTDLNQKNPATLGYAMPAEWAPHRATWLSWPHNLETWPTQLETVREIWVRMIQALADGEEVNLLVNDDRTQHDVAVWLNEVGATMEHISILKIPTVDVLDEGLWADIYHSGG